MKIKWLLFFLLLFGITGYFREFFFVHMNRIMYEKFYHVSAYEHDSMPAIMSVFNSWSYPALYYSKYPFTLLFTFIFFALSWLTLKKLTNNKVLLKILLFTYIVMLLIAGVSMLYGYLVCNRLQSDEYTLSRWLLGIAQSPIICLILLASEKLYNNTIQSSPKK